LKKNSLKSTHVSAKQTKSMYTHTRMTEPSPSTSMHSTRTKWETLTFADSNLSQRLRCDRDIDFGPHCNRLQHSATHLHCVTLCNTTYLTAEEQFQQGCGVKKISIGILGGPVAEAIACCEPGCSMLQCVAVCCSVLQCVTVCQQCVAVFYSWRLEVTIKIREGLLAKALSFTLLHLPT